MDTVDFISEERLKTYENHTDRREKAVALHNHTLQLGSSLMSMIALLELSLRNSTNQQLIADFGDVEWLLPGHSTVPLKSFERKAVGNAIAHARKAAYSKLSHREKTYLDAFAYPGGVPTGTKHKTAVKRRQALFVVSHGQVVSQTTFSFWKRLYSGEYDGNLWKPSLKKVFPDKKLRRSDISRALETVYATRNRVAHHEPVYGDRLSEAIDALEFLRSALAAKSNAADTSFKRFSRIQYLRLRMDYESFLDAWRTLT